MAWAQQHRHGLLTSCSGRRVTATPFTCLPDTSVKQGICFSILLIRILVVVTRTRKEKRHVPRKLLTDKSCLGYPTTLVKKSSEELNYSCRNRKQATSTTDSTFGHCLKKKKIQIAPSVSMTSVFSPVISSKVTLPTSQNCFLLVRAVVVNFCVS
jgi:hypothetical protein